MKKLISMVEYIELVKVRKPTNPEEELHPYTFKLEAIFRYARLLLTPLELGQFIPCNEKGEPMEKPSQHSTGEFDTIEVMEWDKALESVLFEGNVYKETMFGKNRQETIRTSDDKIIAIKLTLANGEVMDDWYFKNGYNGNTIEDLITSGIELTPTEVLKNQLGL